MTVQTTIQTKHETIYGIFRDGADGEPLWQYVGKTTADLMAYWKHTHKKNCLNGIEKALYEEMRHIGIEHFYITALSDDGSMSEADWIRELTIQGHKLLNENRGNTVQAKRPSRAKSTFQIMNREAAKNLEVSERKKRLHGIAQQLSKSELVRQRITGAVPTFEEMMEAEYRPCPGEMLSTKLGKSAERAEYTKLGDFTILCAFRKGDKEVAVLVRNRNGEELNAGTASYHTATKAKIVGNAAEHWASSDAVFQKVWS